MLSKNNFSKKDKYHGKNNTWSTLGLALDLGFIIAIPLVVLSLLGRYADKKLATHPWLFLCSILIALSISMWLVYNKVSAVLSEFNSNDLNKKKQDKER